VSLPGYGLEIVECVPLALDASYPVPEGVYAAVVPDNASVAGRTLRPPDTARKRGRQMTNRIGLLSSALRTVALGFCRSEYGSTKTKRAFRIAEYPTKTEALPSRL